MARSSFNGRITEIPGICVDNFENPATDGARAYFLSHFHTDHTVGLDKDALKFKLVEKKNVFIYTTKMTSAIIAYNFDLKDYVRELKLGSNLIVLPGDEQNEEVIVNVTLVPAGHCLGSTMFLFETTSVRVLFTGDFRIRTNDLPKYSAFHNNGEVIKLNKLYIDTTFINNHESFPKRSDSIEETIMLIRRYLDSHHDQLVVLDTKANYGYEYVFNQIYKSLGMKVYVDDWKWEFYCTIQKFVLGVTNNANETRIFLRQAPVSKETSVQYKRITFSAYRWDDWNEEQTSIQEKGNQVYVCFSTHCSRTELINFVDYLNPAKVVGFPNPYVVKNSPMKVDDGEKFSLSPRQTPQKKPVKRALNDKKVDSALLKKIFG